MSEVYPPEMNPESASTPGAVPPEPAATEAPTSDLTAELRCLGDNLRELLRSAWENEERKKLQQEISSGLKDLSSSINAAVTEFNSTHTGQRLRGNVDELRSRIRPQDLENKLRGELVGALRKVNQELEKAATGKKEPPAGPETPPPTETHPPADISSTDIII